MADKNKNLFQVITYTPDGSIKVKIVEANINMQNSLLKFASENEINRLMCQATTDALHNPAVVKSTGLNVNATVFNLLNGPLYTREMHNAGLSQKDVFNQYQRSGITVQQREHDIRSNPQFTFPLSRLAPEEKKPPRPSADRKLIEENKGLILPGRIRSRNEQRTK